MRRLVVLLLLLPFSLPLFAERTQPSTAEERARAVKLTRQLESDPLNAQARESREWLLKWIEEVPDIQVPVCNLLPPLMESRRRFGRELMLQIIFGTAAYIIENPRQAAVDETAVFVAGVESMLKAYESHLKARPDARWPYVDSLIELRNRGELARHIRTLASERCMATQPA